MMSLCFAYPLSQLARDHTKGRDVVLGMDKHRHVAVEIRDLAVPPFKGQFVGDVGYASGKQRQMTLRHKSGLPGRPCELRPAPGSFLNPLDRVTRPSSRPLVFCTTRACPQLDPAVLHDRNT